MNPNQKAIIAFGIGLFGGGALGYFVGLKKAREEARLQAEREIEDIRIHYQNKFGDPDTNVSRVRSDLEIHNDEEMLKLVNDEYGPTPPEEWDGVESEASAKQGRQVTFEGLIPEVVDPEFDDTEPDNNTQAGFFSELSELMKKRKPSVPYVISNGEFQSEEGLSAKYDKLVLTYYKGDDKLVGENNEIVQNIDRLIGLDNFEHVGKFSGMDNVIHIRNEDYDTDYEIHISEEGFVESVLNSGGKKKKFTPFNQEDD